MTLGDLFVALLSPVGVLAAMLGYAFGSIPFGLILTRLAGTRDIRTIGSGNIGATNVLRTGRKDLAAATLLLDGFKGAAAVLAAGAFFGAQTVLIAGFAAFLGHLFPVWLRFEGGKGVATFIGVLAGLWWPGALVFCVIWLGVAYVTRYSSLSALIASAATPAVWFLLQRGGGATMLLLLGMTLLLWWKHRANIERLLSGSEGRIGHKG